MLADQFATGIIDPTQVGPPSDGGGVRPGQTCARESSQQAEQIYKHGRFTLRP